MSLEEKGPLNFRFIPNNALSNVKPNEKARVSTIDHTVVNVYG